MEQNTLWVNKESSLGHKISQQKNSVVILLAVVLAAYVLSVCVAFFWSNAAFAIVQPLFFLAIGIFHFYRLESDFQSLTATQKWIYTVVVATTVFLLFWIASLWGIRFSFLAMLAGAVAFLLPFVLSELAKTYLQLAFGNAALWQVTNEASLTYPDVYLKGIPFRFKLMEEESGNVFFQTEFRTLTDMRLREVFYDMMQKQTKKGIDSAALFNDEKRPYRWLFFTSNFPGWSRALDPNLTLAENNLKKDSVVYVQRLSPGNAVVSKEQKALNVLI